MSRFWSARAETPGWAHDVTVTLLDRELRIGWLLNGTYSYAATFRVERYAVRVRLRVASRRARSSAVAEVLASNLTWTSLVDAEPPGLLPFEVRASRDHPDVFAQELLWRACAVLLGLPGMYGDGT